MKIRAFFVVVFAVVGGIALGMEPSTPAFEARDRVGSLWVPLRALLTPAGDLDLSRFQPYEASAIRLALKPASNQIALSAPGSPLTFIEACGHIAVTTSAGPSPEHSLDELAGHATTVFTGRIVSAEPGFLSGTPGSLLLLSSLDVSLGSVSATGSAYVFFPFAHAAAGRYLLCKSDLRFTLRPQIGDTLVVFAVSPSLDKGNSLFQPGPSQVFLETNGSLQAGVYMSKESLPSTAKGLLEAAKALRTSGAAK